MTYVSYAASVHTVSFDGMPATSQLFDGELIVSRVRFLSDDRAFAVLAAHNGSADELTVAGPLGHLDAGDRAQVRGRFERHPRFGLQLRAEEARCLDPDDRQGTLAYLETIKHVGPRRAEALVERHGEDVFDRIDGDAEAAFSAVAGIGPRAAREAAEAWRERRALRELYVLLAPHGLARLATKLHEHHGSDAVAQVRSDPYRLTELWGVGFQTADRLARGVGVDSASPRRGHAATMHLLAEAESQGHTHLPLTELTARARPLVGELRTERVEELSAEGLVELEAERVYRTQTHRQERWLAGTLAGLAGGRAAISATVGSAPEDGLAHKQWEAVRRAFGSRLSLVTGGPGTGKTMLCRALVAHAERVGVRVSLCAPTGRAARRLSELTGREAQTIHRLLDWVPDLGPMHDRSNPLGCGLLVVDESSMLNLRSAAMLFDAVGPATHVVLVGDADQLPPIGAGKPFSELVVSDAAPVTRLEHIFRQAARSLIVQAAHAINRGERPREEARADELADFFFCRRSDVGRCADAVVELAAERLPARFGFDPVRDVQVLCPIYRGPAGIEALNERLRERLNPHGKPCHGGLRIGDKVIQTRNDYATGLMNGQVCLLRGEDSDEQELLVEVDDGRSLRVGYGSADALRLAYAVSVHKAQGSEAQAVVVALHSAHGVMLSRNLLYTAVTRARRACVVVGERRALERALSRPDAERRHSALAERVARLV